MYVLGESCRPLDIHPEKLHLAVLGRKCDPGKKTSKKNSTDTPKGTPKKAKKNTPEKQQEEGAAAMETGQVAGSTQDDALSVDTNKELLDLFAESEHCFNRDVDDDL